MAIYDITRPYIAFYDIKSYDMQNMYTVFNRKNVQSKNEPFASAAPV